MHVKITKVSPAYIRKKLLPNPVKETKLQQSIFKQSKLKQCISYIPLHMPKEPKLQQYCQ